MQGRARLTSPAPLAPWVTGLALFAGCGEERGASSEGVSMDAGPETAETAEADARPPEPDASAHGAELGEFQFTYYWIARERSDTDKARVLRDMSCEPIARVSRRFNRRARLEGTGTLRDGRTVNVAGKCDCGGICFFVTGPEHRWGAGVRSRPLRPFRSVAVDPSVVNIGQTLYIPELDGIRMPGRKPWGGYVHDGCVVADDQGGGIDGRQLDFFAGRPGFYRAIREIHGISSVTVHDGADRCEDTADRPQTSGRHAS